MPLEAVHRPLDLARFNGQNDVQTVGFRNRTPQRALTTGLRANVGPDLQFGTGEMIRIGQDNLPEASNPFSCQGPGYRYLPARHTTHVLLRSVALL